MLQMIILFIMASVVVVTGLVAVSQAQIQGRAQEYTLINQRLDAAARAVEQTMKEYPGMLDVGVLSPETSPSGMPIMPAAMGAARTTPWGSFFRYCPIANQDVRAVMSDNVVTIVSPKSGDPSYSVTSYRGTVIHDDVTASGSGVVGIQAIKEAGGAAIITAPAKPDGIAPSCNSVSFVNGKPRVTNGFVRVVNFPNEVGTSGNDVTSRKMTSYFVSQTGSGDMSGKDSGNTAPVIAAFSDLTTSKSNEISINVVGAISPPWNNWNNFLTNSAIGRRVYLSGGEIIVPINPASANNNFPIIGDWELKDVIITNGMADISSASKLSLSGEIIWRNNSVQKTSINNRPGGRLDAYNANINFKHTPQAKGSGSRILINNGEMNFKDSNMWFSSGTVNYMIINLGEIYSKNSKIGTQSNLVGQRPLISGITFLVGKSKLVSTGITYVIGSVASTATCWSDGDAVTFIGKWSQSNTYGSMLSFPAETTYAESNSTNPSATYLNEAAERRLARENASGTIICA